MLGNQLLYNTGGVGVTTLNSNTLGLGDLALTKRKVIATAYCTSRACCGVLARVEIELTTDSDVCPDCGHALYFRKRVVRR